MNSSEGTTKTDRCWRHKGNKAVRRDVPEVVIVQGLQLLHMQTQPMMLFYTHFRYKRDDLQSPIQNS